MLVALMVEPELNGYTESSEKSELRKFNECKRTAERKRNRHQRVHKHHRYRNNSQKYKSNGANAFCPPSEENSNSKLLIIRPNRGPLMNAPRNSTQFIIDDHEDEDQPR